MSGDRIPGLDDEPRSPNRESSTARSPRVIEPFVLPACTRCRERPAVTRWGADDRPAMKIKAGFMLCGPCCEAFTAFLAGLAVPGVR